MDIEVKETRDGKDYNKLGEEIISCELCAKPTTMLGTKRCDSCWELERRVKADPALARRILSAMQWRAVSGHPSGWRVVRGAQPLEELKNSAGALRIFPDFNTAERVAYKLNKEAL